MNHTWMIVTKKNYLIVFEIFYFYLFLIKYFNFIFLINKIKASLNSFTLFKYKFFFFTKFNFINFKNLFNNDINKFFNYSINIKYNKFKIKLFSDNKSLKTVNFLSKQTNIEYKLFTLYFAFNYSLFNSNFKVHTNIQMFSSYNYSNKLLIFDPSKFLIR